MWVTAKITTLQRMNIPCHSGCNNVALRINLSLRPIAVYRYWDVEKVNQRLPHQGGQGLFGNNTPRMPLEH